MDTTNRRAGNLRAFLKSEGIDFDELRRWNDEFGGGGADIDDPQRFAVFERNELPGDGTTLVTTYETAQDAADRVRVLISESETADWQPFAVIDLDTGARRWWDVVVTLRAEEGGA